MLAKSNASPLRTIRKLRAALLLLICFSFFLAVAGPPSSFGQNLSDPHFESCPRNREWIELTVVAARMPDEPQELFWKIKEMPGADKVSVRCAGLKQRIVDELRQTSPGLGTLQTSDGVRLDLYLMGEINDYDFGIELPGRLFNPPPSSSDLGREFKVVLCVVPAEGMQCESPPARAEIEVATAAGRVDCEAGVPPTFTFDGPVPFKLFYGTEDLAAARKDPSVITDEQAHERIRSELREVAEAAYAQLRSQEPKVLDENGRPLFTNRNDPRAQMAFDKYNDEMKKSYLLRGHILDVGWTGDVKTCQKCVGGCDVGAANPAVWVWGVDGLRLVEGVNIDVLEEDWETKEAQGEIIAAKLRKRRQKAYDRLRADILPKLAIRPGHLANSGKIGRLPQKNDPGMGDLALFKKEVEAVEKVRSGPVVRPGDAASPASPTGDRNIIYAVRRKKKPELVLALNAGGSYSKEDGGTAHFGGEEVNLLRLKETIAFRAEGGGEVQRYKFSFSRPFERSDMPRLEIRDFSIDAQIFKDKDRRLGNLTAEEISAREVGSTASISFGYDSASEAERANDNCLVPAPDSDCRRKRTRYSFLADAGLSYRDINIRDDDKLISITGVGRALLPRERTQATAVSLGINALLRHDFRTPGANGLGVLIMRMEGSAERGFHLFGADYRYWKSRTVVSGDLTFGFSSTRDMFVRYRHGHEHGSDGTPIFDLPLLGGADSIRGLEVGELIGRRVSFEQFELGLNAASIWKRLARRGRISDGGFCPCDGKQPGGPFDFQNLYVKGFFDYGRLSGSPVATAGIGVLRHANGYGLAVELRDLMADASGRRVNLSIGYGRSPHSRLHRAGLMFTGVTFDF